MKITKRMPSFEGVAAGATATLRCPIGLTYHQILISYSNVTLAEMLEIRVIGNGKTFQRYTSGTRLDQLNQFNNRAAANGVLVIDFTRNVRTRALEELTALGTGYTSQELGEEQLQTLAVEIDIDAAATGVALSAKAIQSERRALGLIRHVREYTYTAAATGEFEIADIPRGHLFNQVHFVSAGVDELRIERDGFVAFDRTEAENVLIQTDGGYRDPVTGVFSFDPTELGHGGETLQTAGVQDLRFICTMGATGQVPVVVESIAPLK